MKFYEGCGDRKPEVWNHTLCVGQKVSDLSAEGVNLKWYSFSSGGEPLSSNTLLSTGIFYVSQTIDGCESTRAAVHVTLNTVPTLTNAEVVQPSSCGGSGSISFSTNMPNGNYFFEYYKNGVWITRRADAFEGRVVLSDLKIGEYSNFRLINWNCLGTYNSTITLVQDCNGAAIASGASGSWDDGTTWASGEVPDGSNDVTITNGSSVEISGQTAARSTTNYGVLSGNGQLTGDLHNAAGGVIAPGESPGCIGVGGVFSNEGTVDIEVWGKTTSCEDFDQLTVSGAATLDGTLQVSLHYTSADGDIITFLDAASVTGTFSSVSPALPDGWVVRYNYPSSGKVSLLYGNDPLPVKFVSFTGRRQDDGSVLLNWSTATERQNAGFSVERSNDAERWESIGFVAGQGTSDVMHSYTFRDPVRLGQKYYRIRQKDVDGGFSFSEVIVISARSGEEFSVYPNPVKDHLQWAGLEEYSGEKKVRVYDQLGRYVLSQRDQRESLDGIDVSELAAGRYILEIEVAGTKIVRQFIKQ